MFDLLCFLDSGVGCGWVCVTVGLCCHEVSVAVKCGWGSVEKN